MSLSLEQIIESLNKLASVESDERENALDTIAEFIEETDKTASELFDKFDPILKPLFNVSAKGASEESGNAVFGRAFAVLVYAGLVEKDGGDESLNDLQRQNIVNLAVNHLNHENDFRGFTNDVNGWAHSIAHVADLIGEVFQSNRFTAAQAGKIRTAIIEFFNKPHSGVLQHNEEERLALAVVRAIYSERFDHDAFYDFLAQVLGKNDEEHPWYQQAFRDAEQQNRINNVKRFVQALYFQIKFHDSVTEKDDLMAGIDDVMRELDEGFYNFNE